MISDKIEAEVKKTFSEPDVQIALEELKGLTLEHVMASSQKNLDNTYLAILKLSKGEIARLKELVISAKKDFRDVIYWAETDK